VGFAMDIIYIYLFIYLEVCRCIYRVCSNRSWDKYEYRTILQFVIQLIYFRMF